MSRAKASDARVASKVGARPKFTAERERIAARDRANSMISRGAALRSKPVTVEFALMLSGFARRSSLLGGGVITRKKVALVDAGCSEANKRSDAESAAGNGAALPDSGTSGRAGAAPSLGGNAAWGLEWRRASKRTLGRTRRASGAVDRRFRLG